MKRYALCGFIGLVLSTGLSADTEVAVGAIDQEAILPKELSNVSVNWIVDRYMSPYAGAEDLIAFHYLLQKTEDWMLPPHAPPKLGFFPLVGRWLELLLFWNPLNEVMVTTQHEVFGHGYRIRTLDNIEENKYKIKAPFPYGRSGGVTYFEINENFTVPELQTVVIGGFDAEAVMARRLKMKWIQAGYIEPRAASLYTQTAQGLVFYALATNHTAVNLNALTRAKCKDVGDGEEFDEAELTGNDIKDYLVLLNATYPSDPMSRGKFDRNIYLNLLDPMTYYTWLASPVIYMAYGKGMHVPMIHIGDVSFLPNVKVQPAPYGLEYYVENYLLYDDRPIYTYVKGGKHNHIDYYGLGFECEEMLRFKKGSLGMIFDAWYQPKFLTSWTIGEVLNRERPLIDGMLQDRSIGASLSAVSKWHIFGKKAPLLYLSVGYKSRGYLQGEALKASPIVRLGFSGDF